MERARGAPRALREGDEYALALPNEYTYCSGQVVNNLDDLFGRYFVSLRLQPEKAQVARSMITWIRQAFERNLPSISWMDDATRAVALDKAYAVLELVGGPENGNWVSLHSRVHSSSPHPLCTSLMVSRFHSPVHCIGRLQPGDHPARHVVRQLDELAGSFSLLTSLSLSLSNSSCASSLSLLVSRCT